MSFDPIVLCRPAGPRDRDQAMAFLADIWEGDDYVPELWEHWLYHDSGLLAVAELEGKVVGLGHLEHIVDDQWWLEGLRVDPAVREQGIGSKLHNYFIERWLKTDGQVVRLATHSHRRAVRKMCERTGFRQLASFIPLTMEPPAARNLVAEEVDPADWPAAIRAFKQSKCTGELAGLVDYHWQFAEASSDWLGSNQHDHLLAGPGGDYYALRFDRDEGGTSLHLMATSAAGEQLEAGLRAVSGWAASHSAVALTWLPPTEPSFVEPALAAGFKADEEGELLIYERRK